MKVATNPSSFAGDVCKCLPLNPANVYPVSERPLKVIVPCKCWYSVDCKSLLKWLSFQKKTHWKKVFGLPGYTLNTQHICWLQVLTSSPHYHFLPNQKTAFILLTSQTSSPSDNEATPPLPVIASLPRDLAFDQSEGDPIQRMFSSWWFQPAWKILVKLDHLPK